MAKLKTGRHTSALKEARKTEKRTARNAAMKSKIRPIMRPALDFFLGLGSGGICSTSILLTTIALLVLSFNKLYKKEIPIAAIIIFIVIKNKS